jgi:predicted unusual protein kinase regulating ubiquinone biosynthesis (AarF/ABC1/UbiB family)
MIDYILKNGFRILETIKVFGSKGISLLLENQKPTPLLLRESFEELGTTYIKLGQFIASTPSLFPQEYVQEFQKCLDQTSPIPFSEVEKVLKEEFNKPLNKIFDYIEKEALASASIAQVHAAKLKDGTDVVLKVQKPGVKDIILTDMNFVYIASKVFELLIPEAKRLSLSEIIEDLQKSMINECDFILEAKHTKQFRKFIKDFNINDVVVPYIYDTLTTSRVITMERLYGIPLRDPQSIKKYTNNPAEVISKALNVWFLSLLYCDFFHADVHAGNLMLLEDGRIAFIDFGIIGQIKKTTWNGLQKILISMESDPINYSLMAEGLMESGIANQKVDKNKFARELEISFRLIESLEDEIVNNPDLQEEEINKKLLTIVNVAKENGIRFPREFGLLLKQLLYFDRYIRTLAPEISIANNFKKIQ